MKIKVIVEDVGANHATVEIEEACGMDGLERLLAGVNRELTRISAKKSVSPRNSFADGRAKDTDSTPASEDALKALWGAAMSNHTDVESVCREYGVDPDHISKKECWRMTHDLNERSGYGQN